MSPGRCGNAWHNRRRSRSCCRGVNASNHGLSFKRARCSSLPVTPRGAYRRRSTSPHAKVRSRSTHTRKGMLTHKHHCIVWATYVRSCLGMLTRYGGHGELPTASDRLATYVPTYWPHAVRYHTNTNLNLAMPSRARRPTDLTLAVSETPRRALVQTSASTQHHCSEDSPAMRHRMNGLGASPLTVH